jgi:hypothetical protein
MVCRVSPCDIPNIALFRQGEGRIAVGCGVGGVWKLDLGGGGQWQAATLMAMQVANGKGGNVRVLLVVE